MTGRILMKAIMIPGMIRGMIPGVITGVLLALGGCNMYVIDFENKLPDGSVLAPKTTMPAAPPPPPPTPLAGSEDVAFMDSTTAQLEGCRVITGVRLVHDGAFEDGLIKLRNTAIQINANRIIPLRIVESPANTAPHAYSAKMVRCPDEKVETANG
jgi:hypothetical protein